jgi:hypothetical protein
MSKINSGESLHTAGVVKLNLSQPPGRALVKKEIIVGRIVSFGNFREFAGVEKIIRHELDDQGHVHVHGALKFRQRNFVNLLLGCSNMLGLLVFLVVRVTLGPLFTKKAKPSLQRRLSFLFQTDCILFPLQQDAVAF